MLADTPAFPLSVYATLILHRGRKMRILITGGAGFLGSHLSEKLLDQDHDVLALDNFYTGNKANISQLLVHPKLASIISRVCAYVKS